MPSDLRSPSASYPPDRKGGSERWWTFAIESLIRSLLDSDPHTRESLAGLEAKVVDIVIEGSEGEAAGGFRLLFEAENLRVVGHSSDNHSSDSHSSDSHSSDRAPSPGEGEAERSDIDPPGAARGGREPRDPRGDPREGASEDPASESKRERERKADPQKSADLTIRGTPFSLLRFAAADDREEMLLSGEVVLHGDTALAARLQVILSQMDIDFEELLARRIGDIPAHALMRQIRGFGAGLREAGGALAADLSEYLRYETALLARQDEGFGFVQGVDDMRDDAARLEARIARLEDIARKGERG